MTTATAVIQRVFNAAGRLLRRPALPVISYIQAGGWTSAPDPYAPGAGFAEMAVDSSIGPRAFALQIRGDSMADRFVEGDRVAIDPDVQPKPGDFVAAKADREDTPACFR